MTNPNTFFRRFDLTEVEVTKDGIHFANMLIPRYEFAEDHQYSRYLIDRQIANVMAASRR